MKLQSTAYQKFIHEAPRKLRLVADAIRGKKMDQVLDILKFSPRRSSATMLKIINQAKANAASTHELKPDQLTVKDIVVEEGPRIKRWRPVSRGMAHSIIKRTSHVKVMVVGDKVEKPTPTPVAKPSKQKKGQ